MEAPYSTTDPVPAPAKADLQRRPASAESTPPSKPALQKSASLTYSQTTPRLTPANGALQKSGSLILGEVELSNSSMVIIRKGLSRVEKLDPQIELGSKQLGLSLSAEESALLVDNSGILRDELGFEIGVSVGSQPPSRRNTSNSSHNEAYTSDSRTSLSIRRSNLGPSTSFLQSMSRSGPRNPSLAQRRAWDEFLQQIEGSLEAIPTTDIQRWRKNTPRDALVLSSRDSAADDESQALDNPQQGSSSFLPDKNGSRRKVRVLSRIFSLRISSRPRNHDSSFRFSSDSPLNRFNRATNLMFASSKLHGRMLTQLIRTHGIPTEIRAQVWIACTGAREKQQQASQDEQYDAVLTRALATQPESLSQIELDLHRTFPTNYVYQQDEGIASLRHVLLAYSLRNSSVGYCQSMNFIVATLLLHMDEADAYWVLSAIVEDLVPGYFSRDLIGVRVDQNTFISLVTLRFPRVVQHLNTLQMPLSVIAYQWFMCLFVNTLPLGTTLRVWDVFLHEGAKALFRVALTIIKILQRDILACTTFQEAYEVLNESPKDRQRFSGTRVFRAAFDPIIFGSFSSKMLAEIRQRQLAVIEREQQQSAAHRERNSAAIDSPLKTGANRQTLEDNGVPSVADEGETSARCSTPQQDIEPKHPPGDLTLPSLKRDAATAGLNVAFSWGFSPRPSPFADADENRGRPRASTLRAKVSSPSESHSAKRTNRARSFESSLPDDVPSVKSINQQLGEDDDKEQSRPMQPAANDGDEERSDDESDDATIWDSDDDDHVEAENRLSPSTETEEEEGELRDWSMREEKPAIPTVDLPAEFSQRLKSLAYVMNARQTSTAAAMFVSSPSHEHLPNVPEEDTLEAPEILKAYEGVPQADALALTRSIPKISSSCEDPPIPITQNATSTHRSSKSLFRRLFVCGSTSLPMQ